MQLFWPTGRHDNGEVTERRTFWLKRENKNRGVSLGIARDIMRHQSPPPQSNTSANKDTPSPNSVTHKGLMVANIFKLPQKLIFQPTTLNN